MRRFAAVTTCVALAVAFAGAGVCEAAMNIAVVDMARLVKGHPHTSAAEERLESQMEQYEDEQRELLEQRSELRDALQDAIKEAQNNALSDVGREAKRLEAETKQTELRELERNIRETLVSRQKELAAEKLRATRAIIDKIKDVVSEYARDKGYDVVLDSSGVGLNGSETVVFTAEQRDITEDILKLLRKSAAPGE